MDQLDKLIADLQSEANDWDTDETDSFYYLLRRAADAIVTLRNERNAIAERVRAETIAECAKVCESERDMKDPAITNDADDVRNECAESIRSLPGAKVNK